MQRYADAWFDDTVVLIESGRTGLRTDERPAVLSNWGQANSFRRPAMPLP
jgi:hypothetical protein